MNGINLFTDGSSLIQADGKDVIYESSSGCIIYANNHILAKAGKYHIGGTVSIGEAYAVLLGLNIINKYFKDFKSKLVINIYSDSAFICHSIDSWIYKWAKQGNDVWLNSEFKPVACQNIFKKIYTMYLTNTKYHINIYKVNGHIGHKISINNAYAKFNKKNNLNITKDEFKEIVNGNILADEIADYVRVHKIYKYMCKEDMSCLIKLGKNQRILISKKEK